MVVVLVTACQRSLTFLFYDELDKVLHDRLSFCPVEGDMLNSDDANISSCSDATARSGLHLWSVAQQPSVLKGYYL